MSFLTLKVSYPMARVTRNRQKEHFYDICNRWPAAKRRSEDARAALLQLAVSQRKLDDIMQAATTFWEKLGGPALIEHNINKRAVVRLREALKKELRDAFPELFGRECNGRREREFRYETGPDIIFYQIHTKTQTPKNGRKIQGVRSQTLKTTGETEGVEMKTITKRDVIDLTEDSENTTVVKEEEETLSKMDIPSVGSAGSTSSKESTEHTSIKANEESTAASSEKSTTIGTELTLYVEVFSANENAELFCLESSHLAKDQDTHSSTEQTSLTPSLRKLEEQVKEYPLINWPEKLMFLYICPRLHDKTLFIFSQATLETAFAEWCRDATGANVFRVYVNELDGRPPRITLS